MDFFPRKQEPDVKHYKEGPVYYMDGSALKRPLTVPLPLRIFMALFVVAAVVIGIIFLQQVHDVVVNEPLREAEATQQNLSREVELRLPLLKDITYMDDASILQSFADAGYTMYDLSPTEGVENVGFDVIKLPDGVSLIDAGLMYSKGVSNLSSADASKLLNGSWRMTVSRAGSGEMKLKYADFTSGGVQEAVQNAIVNQGLAESILGEAGVDNAGNTFQSGQVDVDGAGTLYNWQVFACELSGVYSVDGLPESAAYVGIRMYY